MIVPETPGTFSKSKSPDGLKDFVSECAPERTSTCAAGTEAPLESRTVPSTRVPPGGSDCAFKKTGRANNTQQPAKSGVRSSFAGRSRIALIGRSARSQRSIGTAKGMCAHHNSETGKLTIEV